MTNLEKLKQFGKAVEERIEKLQKVNKAVAGGKLSYKKGKKENVTYKIPVEKQAEYKNRFFKDSFEEERRRLFFK